MVVGHEPGKDGAKQETRRGSSLARYQVSPSTSSCHSRYSDGETNTYDQITITRPRYTYSELQSSRRIGADHRSHWKTQVEPKIIPAEKAWLADSAQRDVLSYGRSSHRLETEIDWEGSPCLPLLSAVVAHIDQRRVEA